MNLRRVIGKVVTAADNVLSCQYCWVAANNVLSCQYCRVAADNFLSCQYCRVAAALCGLNGLIIIVSCVCLCAIKNNRTVVYCCTGC